MTVFIVIEASGYVCGVFDSESKAYDFGNQYCAGSWDVIERVVE